jgi:hypothetical protein
MSRKLSYKDYEGDMAKAQLEKIEMYAEKLNEMIHPEDELEAWVQTKLSIVAAYMGDVKHYLDYQLKKMGEEAEEWQVEMKHGGKTSSGLYRIEPSTLAEDMIEARDLVGKDAWNKMSRDERYELTNSLKMKGKVGHYGEEEDIEFLSSLQYEKGGELESNKEMLKNLAHQIQHHSEELKDVIEDTDMVEAWVVSKAERAATDLSDITHYLDGQ